MVSDPTGIAARLTPRQQDYIIFHYEALRTPQDVLLTLAHLKNMHCHVGMAINPETPISTTQPYLEHLDALLIMSVNPGASGQVFIQNTMEKIEQLTNLRTASKPNLLLMVDGGISIKNIALLSHAGIDACAVASAIFSAFNPQEAIKELYKLASNK
jgi:ribulose-phosphate 3-epimerase